MTHPDSNQAPDGGPLDAGLVGLTLQPEYDTEQDSIVRDLYSPCLARSAKYDRAVGYFRANVYRELGEDLLDFALRGGKARLVCSPDLPEPDEMAARTGYDRRGTRSGPIVETDLLEVIRAMAANPDEADCLAMLEIMIERGSLDLFVAVRPGGIYHRKIGRFIDRLGNVVVFSGSGNETPPVFGSIEDWSNDEEFDVFCSWGTEFERGKIRRKGAYLDRLFSGGTSHTRVRPLNAVEHELLVRYRKYDGLDECREGARRRSPPDVAPEIESAVEQVEPYFFQRQAIERWEQAGRNGLLCMATGTGKTITALFAIRPLIDDGVLGLIVVPSTVLLDQWWNAIRGTYPGVPVMRAGGGFDWRAESSKRMYVTDSKLPRMILATMQTASSSDFIEFVRQADRCVLVADEVHRLGSEKNRLILEVPFSARLGLSATPERLYDPEGSAALAKAFGDQPLYTLPIGGRVRLSPDDTRETPILGRFLSKYTFDFQTVVLDPVEQAEWGRLSAEVRKSLARSNSSTMAEALSDPRLKLLLIQRARVIKKAGGKVALAGLVVKGRYPREGRWIVYCEDGNQLLAVLNEIRRVAPDVASMPYHSKMSMEERAESLQYFEQHPSILVSIRCLDEGVNLPAADGGLILASSTNPREYVQRRGRLLRLAVGKSRATILDAIVLPGASDPDEPAPVSIVKGELARAYQFAKDAENQEVTHRLWKLCQVHGVRPEVDAEAGSEWEEDD